MSTSFRSWAKNHAIVRDVADSEDRLAHYLEIFQGTVESHGRTGYGDSLIATEHKQLPRLWLYGSIQNLPHSLAGAVRSTVFIPGCIGEPGKVDKMLQALATTGIWIGPDIQEVERQKVMRAVQAVLQMRRTRR